MDNRKLIEDMYAAYDRGDQNTVLDALDDALVFTWPTESSLTKLSGSVQGKSSFLERIKELHDEFEYLSFKPIDILVDGDRAAVRVQMQLKRRDNGRPLDTHAAHFLTLRNGKVAELIEYFDTALVEFKGEQLPGLVA